jgi:hypothetical protein
LECEFDCVSLAPWTLFINADHRSDVYHTKPFLKISIFDRGQNDAFCGEVLVSLDSMKEDMECLPLHGRNPLENVMGEVCICIKPAWPQSIHPIDDLDFSSNEPISAISEGDMFSLPC